MARDTQLSLNGAWKIIQLGGKLEMTGRVPGLVHHELIENKAVDDPYYRMNETDQQWVGESTWDYSREFNVSDEQLSRKGIALVFDCIDTVSDIFLNEKKIASTDNFYLKHRLDVKKYLLPGKNEILVRIYPTKKEMLRRAKKYTASAPEGIKFPWDWMMEKAFVRTPASHGGWDWGPCFYTQGLPRPVTIEFRNGPKLLYVLPSQKHSKGKVEVELRAIISTPSAQKVKVEFELAGFKQEFNADLKIGENEVSQKMTIKNPELWWPNGYGKQVLYPLKTTVSGNNETDSKEIKFGFREIELVTEKDSKGESFYFKVNGVPIYCKGSNWVPGDNFDTRLSDEHIQWMLKSAVLSHQNMIRVWGGGLYERDSFYELCDEMGLLVWQDIMFACIHYPATLDFLESVSKEVTHQTRRLMHHASVAIWSGNNEVELIVNPYLSVPDRPKAVAKFIEKEYDKLFLKTIPQALKKVDSNRRYWPSSPSNGLGKKGQPGDHTRGDEHYWNVYHGEGSYLEYLKVTPRFISEFGFQSFPSPETLYKVTSPQDRNVSSEIMEFHQKGKPNWFVMSHVLRNFPMPETFEKAIYLSQAMQGLYMKTACEHWRRSKPVVMGTLIWQLNDIWPGPSWSTVESNGRWKLLHYLQKKYYAPVLVSSVEQDGKLEVWVTSDITDGLKGQLAVTLMDFDGKPISSTNHPVKIGPLGSRKIVSLPIKGFCPEKELEKKRFMLLQLDCGNVKISNEHFFRPFRELELQTPVIKKEVVTDDRGNIILTLETDTLVPFAWIRNGDCRGTWSDNGMHLIPGRNQSLVFHPRKGDIVSEIASNLIIENFNPLP